MPPEELGERALQAEENGLKAENYEGRYNEYLHDIETLDLNPEMSEKHTPEERSKAAAAVLGTALVEHYGKNSGADKFLTDELTAANKNFYTPDRVISYMDTFRNSDSNMENIHKYFDSQLDSLQMIRQVDTKLIEAEKNLGVNEEQAKQNLDAEKLKRSEQA